MARKELCSESGASLLFYLTVIVLTALALFPLWSSRLLPMQDYPQHLLLAQIAATYDQPGMNWKEWYRVDFGFAPYMLWYLAMKPLTLLFGVEVAGKLLLSLYILLISLLALAARRLSPQGHLPWGALLLFPFAFNQLYFQGFANYLISLPLIFLALLDLDSFAAGFRPGKVAKHGLCLALLFLSHPYSVLVYVALAVTLAASAKEGGAALMRRLAPAGAVAALLLAWQLMANAEGLAPGGALPAVKWCALEASVVYYLLPFTGMQWTDGRNWLIILLWLLALLPLARPLLQRKGDDPVWLGLASVNLVSVAGFLALPFFMGYYSHFNLRLAAVSYFALALLLCRLAVPARSGLITGCAAAALLVGSIVVQRGVTAEAETVLPVMGSVENNSLVLPLIFDAAPKAVDPLVFDQMHSHEADYCHLPAGGGANPTLFPNPMMPVQYRPGVSLPSPEQPRDFTWGSHGTYYDYIVTRGAPQDLHNRLAPHCRLVASSGPWCVFRNKAARKPLPQAHHPL